MKHLFAIKTILIIISVSSSGCGSGQMFGPTITLTPTNTFTPTYTSTPTLTITPSPTFTSSPTFTPTPIGGGMGKIAYQLIDGIALINSDGSNQKMLVNDNLSNYFQSWSSSHQRLFYTARIPPRQDVIEKVFSIKIDGSEIEPIEILGGNGIRSIEISPDGKKVIASSGDWGGLPAILYIGDFDGKSVSHLVRLHDGSIPSWSPDGSKIVFASSPQYPQRYSIYTINPDGTHLINLSDKTNTKADSLWPAWSPDGTKIAFSSDRDGNRLAIYVMDSDGTNVMKLNENGQHPAFSPDGKKIAFIHDQEIYIMNSDGTEIVPLTSCDPYGGLIWVP